MSNQYRQMINQLPVARLSVDVLFALAFILNECETEETLNEEIEALSPAYLHEQLLPKWHQCVKKGLANYAWDNQDQPAEVLIDEILKKVQTIHDNNQRYRNFLAKIKRIQHTPSVSVPLSQPADSPLSPDWRKQVMALLLPAFTVFKPGQK